MTNAEHYPCSGHSHPASAPRDMDGAVSHAYLQAELRDLEARVTRQLEEHAAGHVRDDAVRRLARQFWLSTAIAITSAGASITALVWN